MRVPAGTISLHSFVKYLDPWVRVSAFPSVMSVLFGRNAHAARAPKRADGVQVAHPEVRLAEEEEGRRRRRRRRRVKVYSKLTQ